MTHMTLKGHHSPKFPKELSFACASTAAGVWRHLLRTQVVRLDLWCEVRVGSPMQPPAAGAALAPFCRDAL